MINVQADNQIDFWKELTEEMSFMLTETGKKNLAINKTAGILQITDRPSALKKVENYLKGVDTSVHRQVEIECRIYDVTLNDQFQFGIDWIHAAEAYGGVMGFGGATIPVAIGSTDLKNSTVGSLNREPAGLGSMLPGNNLSSLVFSNFNTRAAVTALSQQGNVEVIAKPRLRTLNNQTALIKVGEEVPFFSANTSYLPGTSSGTTTTLQQTEVTSVTIGTILSITPQISENNFVSLDISPVLSSLKAVIKQGDTTAPDLETKQASTIVRVHDSCTVVLGGLIQTEKAKSDNKIPLLGDIPFIGKWLFSGTYRSKSKSELVIFVTPRIIREDEASVIPKGDTVQVKTIKD
jgi:MSHA biogenesis protein MshL